MDIKGLNIFILFLGLSLNLFCQQEIPNRFRCGIDIGSNQSGDFQYGLINFNDEAISSIRPFGINFKSFKVIYSGQKQGEYKISKNKFSFLGSENAILTLGFWGIDPKLTKRHILLTPSNNSDPTDISTLIYDFVSNKQEIFNYRYLEDLELIIINVSEIKKDNFSLYKKLKLDRFPPPHIIYIIWDVEKAKELPEEFIEIENNSKIMLSYPLGSKTNINKNEDNELTVNMETLQLNIIQSNSRQPNKNDPDALPIIEELKSKLVVKINGQTHNIKIRGDEIVFPNILDPVSVECILPPYKYGTLNGGYNLQTGELPVAIGKNQINVQFYNNNEIAEDIKNYNILIMNYDLDVVDTASTEQILGIYKHPLIKYKLSLEDKNKIYSIKTKAINYENFDEPVRINLIQKATNLHVDFIKEKDFNPSVTVPQKYSVKIAWSKMPSTFELPDNLKHSWELSKTSEKILINTKPTQRLDTNITISINRKIEKDVFSLYQAGVLPGIINTYTITAYDTSENITKKNIANLSHISEYLTFPVLANQSDKVIISLEKPFGLNVYEENQNRFINWKDYIIYLIYSDSIRQKKITWEALPPYSVFYIDLSGIKNKRLIISDLEKKLTKLELENKPYLVFVSNLEKPLIFSEKEGYTKVLNAVSRIRTSPPRADKDKDFVAELIPDLRTPIHMQYYVSSQLYKFGWKEIFIKLTQKLFKIDLQAEKLGIADTDMAKSIDYINNDMVKELGNLNSDNLIIDIFLEQPIPNNNLDNIDNPNFKINILN